MELLNIETRTGSLLYIVFFLLYIVFLSSFKWVYLVFLISNKARCSPFRWNYYQNNDQWKTEKIPLNLQA